MNEILKPVIYVKPTNPRITSCSASLQFALLLIRRFKVLPKDSSHAKPRIYFIFSVPIKLGGQGINAIRR